MTRVGTYEIRKTEQGYALVARDGQVVGTFPTARGANAKGVALTAAAYKAKG